MSAPIVYTKRDDLADVALGEIGREHAAHAGYQQLLDDRAGLRAADRGLIWLDLKVRLARPAHWLSVPQGTAWTVCLAYTPHVVIWMG